MLYVQYIPIRYISQNMDAAESQPLLQKGRTKDKIIDRILWKRWLPDENSYIQTTQIKFQRFLTSKIGHYAVLLLVAFDVSCIFAGTYFENVEPIREFSLSRVEIGTQLCPRQAA